MPGPPAGPASYLLDGRATLYPAFPALPPLTTPGGVPPNTGQAFAEYKAQRPPMPDALARQIPHVHRAVEALRVPLLLVEGEEADDILATLARRASGRGVHAVIVTGDKDLLQLV